MAYISRRRFDEARIPSVEESARAVKAHADRRRAKKNWQPKKDPNEFYTRNGSSFAAHESAIEAARRQGEKLDD